MIRKRPVSCCSTSAFDTTAVLYLAVHLALFRDDVLHDGLRLLQLGSRERLAVTEVEPSRSRHENKQDVAEAEAAVAHEQKLGNQTPGE